MRKEEENLCKVDQINLGAGKSVASFTEESVDWKFGLRDVV